MKCGAAVPFIGREHVGCFPAQGTLQYQGLTVLARRSASEPCGQPSNTSKGPNTRGQPSPWVQIYDHGHTVPNQDVAVDNEDHRLCKEEISPPGISAEARNTHPRNAQQRHISVPGPNGTADTEIRYLFLLFLRTASSMSSHSPAQIEHKMSTTKTQIINRRGTMQSSKRSTELNQQADRGRPTCNIFWRDDDERPTCPKCRRARKPG